MKEITPMKAIRQKCLDCSCEQLSEVKECSIKNCALYPFRMGYKLDENGNRRKGKPLSEEAKKKADHILEQAEVKAQKIEDQRLAKMEEIQNRLLIREEKMDQKL